jgi:hypothetical protein
VHIGAGIVVASVILIFIFQIYLFRRLKRNAANLAALSSVDANSTEQENANA